MKLIKNSTPAPLAHKQLKISFFTILIYSKLSDTNFYHLIFKQALIVFLLIIFPSLLVR
jgi:hypothetical protein